MDMKRSSVAKSSKYIGPERNNNGFRLIKYPQSLQYDMKQVIQTLVPI
ncbi:hypothetical protein DSUL_20162 [Desulfovibrionales bacterium]